MDVFFFRVALKNCRQGWWSKPRNFNTRPTTYPLSNSSGPHLPSAYTLLECYLFKKIMKCTKYMHISGLSLCRCAAQQNCGLIGPTQWPRGKGKVDVSYLLRTAENVTFRFLNLSLCSLFYHQSTVAIQARIPFRMLWPRNDRYYDWSEAVKG